MAQKTTIRKEPGSFGSSQLSKILRRARNPTCVLVQSEEGTGCVIYFPKNTKVFAFYHIAENGNVMSMSSKRKSFETLWSENGSEALVSKRGSFLSNVMTALTLRKAFATRGLGNGSDTLILRLKNILEEDNRMKKEKFVWHSTPGPLSEILLQFFSREKEPIFQQINKIVSGMENQ